MKINNREMILINISVTTILFGLLWMLIENKAPEYKNKKIEIERIESQIRLDQRRISMQKKWINELNLLQKNLTTFDYSLKSVSPQLMQTIKNLGKKNNLLKGNMVIHCAYIRNPEIKK